MGVDVGSSFHRAYKSVADFEQKHSFQVPKDLAILLTSKTEPDDAEVYNTRGLAYSESGEHDQAIEDFTKAIELKPECAEAYANRGTAYRDKGEMDKAIADYTKSIVLKPKNC